MNILTKGLVRATSFGPRKLKLTQHVLLSTSATGVELKSEDDGEPDTLYQRLEIELRAPEPETMKSYSQFARLAASELGITVGDCWTPHKHITTDRNQYTLLRAAFARKDYQVQYEIRTYFRYMTFHHLTGSTADTFLEYIERNLPESVAMKITKVAVEKLPEEVTSVRQAAVEELPEEVTSVDQLNTSEQDKSEQNVEEDK